jgi:hypothetical protein
LNLCSRSYKFDFGRKNMLIGFKVGNIIRLGVLALPSRFIVNFKQAINYILTSFLIDKSIEKVIPNNKLGTYL